MRGPAVSIPNLLHIALPCLLGALLLAHFRAGADEEPASWRAGAERRRIMHAGRRRSFHVYVPTSCRDGENVPLVVMLHGGGSNPRNAMRVTGLAAKAEREGFIAAFPAGSGGFGVFRTWNSGNGCGPAKRRNVDDIGFVSALIEELCRTHPVDAGRVYVVGFSNGGMLAHRIGCELGDKVTAIASVSGALNCDLDEPGRPVPVLILHGTADRCVRYEGGKPAFTLRGKKARRDRSVAEAVAFWTSRNGCAPPPIREEQGNVVRETYRAATGTADVVVCTIQGGDHAWPGGKREWPCAPCPMSELSATDTIWTFFAERRG